MIRKSVEALGACETTSPSNLVGRSRNAATNTLGHKLTKLPRVHNLGLKTRNYLLWKARPKIRHGCISDIRPTCGKATSDASNHPNGSKRKLAQTIRPIPTAAATNSMVDARERKKRPRQHWMMWLPGLLVSFACGRVGRSHTEIIARKKRCTCDDCGDCAIDSRKNPRQRMGALPRIPNHIRCGLWGCERHCSKYRTAKLDPAGRDVRPAVWALNRFLMMKVIAAQRIAHWQLE